MDRVRYDESRAGVGGGGIFYASHGPSSHNQPWKTESVAQDNFIPVVEKRRTNHESLRPWVSRSLVVHGEGVGRWGGGEGGAGSVCLWDEPSSKTARQRLDFVLPPGAPG